MIELGDELTGLQVRVRAVPTPQLPEQPLREDDAADDRAAVHLYLGRGISVTGRIDAIFERDDGVWEIVDYKSGVSEPDPLQLGIYEKAVEEVWGSETAASWLLLRDGREHPYVGGDFADLVDAAKRLRDA